MPEHQQDSDCTVDETLVCTVCGVDHGDTCPLCGGHGFHKPTCAAVEPHPLYAPIDNPISRVPAFRGTFIALLFEGATAAIVLIALAIYYFLRGR